MKNDKQTQARATLNVPAAGKILGLGINASYAAAHRGEIPTLKIGGRLLVPKVALDRMLEEVRRTSE